MSKAVQQTLDAKVFAPYQVSERKLSFNGSFTIEKKDLAEKGPGLEPETTYLFMVRGKLAGAAIKFGDDENSGTVSVKVTSLEKYEELEVSDPLVDEPEEPKTDFIDDMGIEGDYGTTVAEAGQEAQAALNKNLDELAKAAVENSKPKRGRKKKVEETFTAGEPVFKDEPTVDEVVAEDEAKDREAQEAEVEPPEDDFPEPSNAIEMPSRDVVSSTKMPPCFETYDTTEEACRVCLDGDACRVATSAAE